MPEQNGFIAVDWGTTNRRAWRVRADGAVEDEFADGCGVLAVGRDGFPKAVAEIRERLGSLPLLMAGMIGSNRGWREAPYVPCPAGLGDLVPRLVRLSGEIAIIPGVALTRPDQPDVMRGEEVQILGGIACGAIPADSRVCHPGTHNKWITTSGGRIVDFRTVITGELFSLLREHSILSDLLSGEVAARADFRAGVRKGLAGAPVAAELFTLRAASVLGMDFVDDPASFASGLLIGADLRVGLDEAAERAVVVVGGRELSALYAAAIEEAGHPCFEVDGEQAFLAGVRKIWEAIG